MGIAAMWFDLRRDGCEGMYLPNRVIRARVEARLVSEGLVPLHWGYLDISFALERSKPRLEFDIPVVREWIAAVGERLYLNLDPPSEQYRVPHSSADLTYGKNLTGKERWRFWKVRLKDLGRLDGAVVKNDVEAMAQETVYLMEQIDEQSGRAR